MPKQSSGRSEKKETFKEIAGDIAEQLDVLKMVIKKRPRRAAAVLDLLRRTRALLLIGDLGTNGQISALANVLQCAAESVAAGADAAAETREWVAFLALHGFRIRGTSGPLLHEALLHNQTAMAHLTMAVEEWASARPREKDARAEISAAARLVGLQSVRTGDNEPVDNKDGGKKRQSGIEPRGVRAIRMAAARANRAAAEEPNAR
jgi:hypothetical protein